MKKGLFIFVWVLAAGCEGWFDSADLNTFHEPIRLQSLQIRDEAGAVVWRLEAKGPRVAVGVLRYGSVPSGCVQTVPAKGIPRPSKMGERLAVLTETAKSISCNRGRATGVASFTMETYAVITYDSSLPAQPASIEDMKRCTP